MKTGYENLITNRRDDDQILKVKGGPSPFDVRLTLNGVDVQATAFTLEADVNGGYLQASIVLLLDRVEIEHEGVVEIRYVDPESGRVTHMMEERTRTRAGGADD